MLSWSPNNTLIKQPDKTSIWSSDVQTAEVKPQGIRNEFWRSANSQSDSVVSEDVWDSAHDPVFHMPCASHFDSWKLSHQNCPGLLSGVPITSVESEVRGSDFGSPNIPHRFNPVTSLPDITTLLSNLALTPRNPDESSSHAKTSVGCVNDNDSAFSIEQLCDRLINTNDGWGKRPIDQATPWEPLDSKLTDQVNRSGITTPTPGAYPSGYISGNFKVPQTRSSDSNVWASEPPTGTAIWETHYESLGGRLAAWEVESQSSNYRDIPTVAHINSNALMNYDLSANSRGATQLPLNNRPNVCQDWDESENRLSNNWDACLSSSSDRSGLLWNSSAYVTGGEDNINSNITPKCPPVTVNANQETIWNDGNTVRHSNGRPVLGGTRPILQAHTQSDEFSWDTDLNILKSASNSSGVSWDALPIGVITTSWLTHGTSSLINSMQTHFPSISDDVKRQQSFLSANSLPQGSQERFLVHPYSNTYRADLVKYLMSQGYKKEDAHAALIACNMEPEKALVELRERYSTNRNMNAITQHPEINRNYGTSNVMHIVTRNGPIQQLSNDLSVSRFAPSCNNLSPSGQNHRLKQLQQSCVTTQSNTTQLLSIQPVPNSQLMRQQITQQVRSALNLSVPSPLGVQINGNSTIGTFGGSLLGQPPPPSLSSININTQTASSANLHLITGLPTATSLCPNKNNHIPTGPVSFSQNSTKRSPRQMSVINSIIELQKKHQSIQHQLTMYHNNPALRSQPQYADVFVELQGQMQQIETQLYAKRAQLNITRAQDPVTQVAKTSLSLSNGVDVFDNSFPAIGTWMAPSPNSVENLDKNVADASVPKMSNFTRTSICKISSNWSSTCSSSNVTNPSSSNIRPTHNQWQQNSSQIRTTLESNINFPVAKGNPTCTVSGETQGQWILVQPLPGWNGASIHNLQSILSTHFKLISFHVLNPNSSSALIRLQSIEDSLQLVKNFGDRLALEPLSDLDARVHLQQLSVNSCADGITSNQLSATEVHATPTNWNSNGQFYSPLNSNNKKSNPYVSRFGLTVCGSK
ncbi:cell wall awa1p [Schistosoma japonicum]|nr:cell wall awa1p [Schistosoma japonicum]